MLSLHETWTLFTVVHCQTCIYTYNMFLYHRCSYIICVKHWEIILTLDVLCQSSKNCPVIFVLYIYIYIYTTFEFKICLCYKAYKFRTETLGGMFSYIYISGSLVVFRFLDFKVCACFGQLLQPSSLWNNKRV